MNAVEKLQKEFQESAEKLQTIQKDYSKALADRQTLDSQLNENRQVKEELDRAPKDCKIYKLIGPALVTQDLTEAKANVEKRIDYISGELKRKDDYLKALDKKQNEASEKMVEVQQKLQKMRSA
uniref:Probable prefoldin subunit 6 n=1 Tax=Pseudodiaptomus poplesia TaxID=213370 RepID=A0A1S6GLF3_9MAXI|nr:putative prefoldin subunit 6 [Pseudodiaptomus poplesia]